MPTLPKLTDIVMTSYLGDRNRPELREVRLKAVLRSYAYFKKGFGKSFTILLITSDYTSAEKKALKEAGVDAVHYPKKTHKYIKHNLVLKTLFKQKKSRVVLFVDDDVRLENTYEGSDPEPFETLKSYLTKPASLPAPVMYFAAYGTLADVAAKSRKDVIIQAPPVVQGWGILIRSDCGVMYDPDVLVDKEMGLLLDDMGYRLMCAANGVLVLKHQLLYFATILNGRSKTTWFDGESATLRLMLQRQREMFVAKYPYIYRFDRRGAFRCLWKSQKVDALKTAKALRLTPYGYVPIPKGAKAYRTAVKKISKKSTKGFL